jgi:hypothetical protein
MQAILMSKHFYELEDNRYNDGRFVKHSLLLGAYACTLAGVSFKKVVQQTLFHTFALNVE